jgi:hypothetical protein
MGKPFVLVQMVSRAKAKMAVVKTINAMAITALKFTVDYSSVLQAMMGENSFYEEQIYAISESGSVRLPT